MIFNFSKKVFGVLLLVFSSFTFPLLCFSEYIIKRDEIFKIYGKFKQVNCLQKYFEENDISKEFGFEFKDKEGKTKKGFLVPLCDCDALKQYYSEVHGDECKDVDCYMWLDVNIMRPPSNQIPLLKFKIDRMWSDFPKSLYFGIAIEGSDTNEYSIVGDMFVSSLVDNNGSDCLMDHTFLNAKDEDRVNIEIAVYSSLVKFMQNMVDRLLGKYYGLKYFKVIARDNSGVSEVFLRQLGFKFYEYVTDPYYSAWNTAYAYHFKRSIGLA